MQRKQGSNTSSLKSLRQGSTDSYVVENYYDNWANQYDENLADWDYKAPEDTSNLMAPYLADGARILDVGCGTGLLGKSLSEHGQFTVDGMDISTESLRHAERSGSYAQVLRHDLQVVPLPVASDTYDAAASVGVLSYIEDAEGLLHDLCRCVRSGGMIAFSQRTDYWEERGFPDLILRLERKGLWSQQQITPPLSYIPGHEDFTDEIKVIHTLCIVT